MENKKYININNNMQQVNQEEYIKLQNKGILTIPKKFRQGFLEENSIVRIKKEKGQLIIEPIRTLPYTVRSYNKDEINEFIAFDKRESKELKKKGLLKK